MLNNLYPIYVINIKRTPERRLHIQRQLDALNLKYQFVEGIDRHDIETTQRRFEIIRLLGLDRSFIEHKFSEQYASFHHNLACTLSHIKVWDLMAKHNDSVACILEDDVIISPDFPKILHAAQKRTWDILMLSSLSYLPPLILQGNLNILKKIEESAEMSFSLFPQLRKTKWIRRWLPLSSTFPFPINLTPISKLEWWLMMLLSHSRTINHLFRHSRACQRLLEWHTANNGKAWFSCRLGAMPIRSSQKFLYGNYDIATPVELPASGMAYLLSSSMARACKAIINSDDLCALADHAPWFLHLRRGIRLRILTPPCVKPTRLYLKYSI